MTVGSQFPGDNNRVLMGVQHTVYGEMVVRLFTGPRDRYLAAAALLRVDSELTQRLRSMNGFDHRTLQMAHDRIAAFFRFARDDGGQLRLGESEADYRRRLEEAWREFVQSEVGWFTATTSLRGLSVPPPHSGMRNPVFLLRTGSTSF
jgi:hypothetical protein